MSKLFLNNTEIINTVQSVYGEGAESRHGVTFQGDDVTFKLESDVLNGMEPEEVMKAKDSFAALVNKVESDFNSVSTNSYVIPQSMPTSELSLSEVDYGFEGTAIVGGTVSSAANQFLKEMNSSMQAAKMKGESFDGIQTRNAKAASLAVNITFERATAFEQVLFPRYHLEDNATTLDITQNIPVLIEHTAKTAQNIASDFRDKFKSISLLMWNQDLIKSKTLKLHHIISSAKDANLINSRKAFLEESLARTTEIKGVSVQVAPIKVFNGNKFNKLDVINTSTISYQSEDVKSERDTLYNVVRMKDVFVEITAGTEKIVHKLNAMDIRNNLFGKRIEQESKGLSLSGNMAFNIPNIAALNAYDPVTDDNTKAANAFANNVSKIGAVTINVVPNIDLAIDSGHLSIGAFTVTISGDDTLIANAGLSIKPVAFNLDATFTNTNLREVGQLIGNAKITFSYGIDYKDPVSIQGPIKDIGNGAATSGNVDLERSINLGTVIAMQSSIHAVNTFLEFRDTLKATVGEASEYIKKLNVMHSDRRTLSYPHVIPYFVETAHNVSNTNSLTSTSLIEDIRNNLKNYIGQIADEMLQQSRYTNALRMVDGNTNKKPCLVVIASENTSKYISKSDVTDPDAITPKPLNRNIDYVVVSLPSDGKTYNPEFQDKIFLTFVEPHVLQSGTISKITPITFGWTLVKNALTYDFQRTAEESVKFISALPIYKHIAQLPVMADIKLNGLSEMIKNKTTIVFENKLFKNEVGIK